HTLWLFWNTRGDQEGYAWLERSLKTSAGSPGLRIQVMLDMACMDLYSRGDYAAARSLLNEIVPNARRLDDRRILADSLCTLGQLNETEGDYAAARAHHTEALALYRELR